MKHVSIVVPKGGVLSGLEISRHVLTEVNEYLIAQGKRPLFKIQLVGNTQSVHLNNGMFTIKTDATITIKIFKKTDLLNIPVLYQDVEKYLEENKNIIEWIVKQYKKGAEVASLCVGAFLLAKTGLLDGRKCTTHWRAAEAFRNLFPNVILMKEKLITDEFGIHSSGGSFSMLNLLLYLVEKYAGREVAIYCAKFFQIDIDRYAQTFFIIFKGQKDHKDDEVKKARNTLSKILLKILRLLVLQNCSLLEKGVLKEDLKKLPLIH